MSILEIVNATLVAEDRRRLIRLTNREDKLNGQRSTIWKLSLRDGAVLNPAQY